MLISSCRTEKAKAKFSRSIKKVKEGAQRLKKTVATSIDNEIERMRELREKVRIAELERQNREQEQQEERARRHEAAEREAKVTKVSFDVDQLIYGTKKIEDGGFVFDYNQAVDLLKRSKELKETIPLLLAQVAPGSESKFSHICTTVDSLATCAARFVKEWQVCDHLCPTNDTLPSHSLASPQQTNKQTGSKTKADYMMLTGTIVKHARQSQQDLMDLILFI